MVINRMKRWAVGGHFCLNSADDQLYQPGPFQQQCPACTHTRMTRGADRLAVGAAVNAGHPLSFPGDSEQ